MLRIHLFALFLCAGFLAACGHTTSPGSDSTGPSNDAVARLTVGVNGHGRVTSTPVGIDCGTKCAADFATGTSVALSPVPDAGWRFAGGGGCTGPAGCNVALATAITVWATFEEIPPTGSHSLAVMRAGNDSGRVVSKPAGIDCGATCTASFTDGTTVVLTATADSGSTFAGWSGACSGSPSCSLKLSGDTSVGAQFDGPPDDCAGLVPAVPGGAPHSAYQRFGNTSSSDICQPGYVNGDGTLALPKLGPLADTSILFIARSGGALRADSSPRTWLTEQADGLVAQQFAGGSSWWLSRWDSQGNRAGATDQTGYTQHIAVDPLGGAAVVREAYYLELHSYDARLAHRWGTLLWKAPYVAHAVDRAGNALVLFDGDDLYGKNTVAGAWLDHDGKLLNVFNALGAQASAAHLVPMRLGERVDNGLFIAVNGAWVAQIEPRATATSEPPAWLKARPNTDLHMVHGGRGYAVLPPAGASGDCAQAIEVFSPSGKSCGANSFRAAAGSCSTQAIRVGYDGTVVQQVPSSIDCIWQWWPGYYGG